MKFDVTIFNKRAGYTWYIENLFPFLYCLLLIEYDCKYTPADFQKQLKTEFIKWGIDYFKTNKLYLVSEVDNLIEIPSISEELGSILIKNSYYKYKDNKVFKDFLTHFFELIKKYEFQINQFCGTYEATELSPETIGTSCEDELQI